MRHFKVKYHNGVNITHFDGVIQPGDMSLCGSDLMGDNHLGWYPAEETTDPVDCAFCARIYSAVKKVKQTEIKKL